MNEVDKIQRQIEIERKDLEWNVLHELEDSEIGEFSEETLEKSRKVDDLIMEYLEMKNHTSEEKQEES